MTKDPQSRGPCLGHSGLVIPSDFVICHSSFSVPVFTLATSEMNTTPKIRAVTFDVGGTLIRPWPSVGHVYGEVAARHGFADIKPAFLNQQFSAAWRAKRNFDHSRPAWLELVKQTFAGALDEAAVREVFDDIYERFAAPAAWLMFD